MCLLSGIVSIPAFGAFTAVKLLGICKHRFAFAILSLLTNPYPMKTSILVSFVLLLCSFSLLAQSDKHKVVIQFNDADSVSQTRVLMQVENIRKVWATADIAVVCLSGGLDLLTKKGSKVSQQISDWKQKGVEFLACNNTMNLRKISKDDLIAPAVVIPSAVIELAVKQEAGWSYFRGGK